MNNNTMIINHKKHGIIRIKRVSNKPMMLLGQNVYESLSGAKGAFFTNQSTPIK